MGIIIYSSILLLFFSFSFPMRVFFFLFLAESDDNAKIIVSAV